jgi:hypothetical protein
MVFGGRCPSPPPPPPRCTQREVAGERDGAMEGEGVGGDGACSVDREAGCRAGQPARGRQGSPRAPRPPQPAVPGHRSSQERWGEALTAGRRWQHTACKQTAYCIPPAPCSPHKLTAHTYSTRMPVLRGSEGRAAHTAHTRRPPLLPLPKAAAAGRTRLPPPAPGEGPPAPPPYPPSPPPIAPEGDPIMPPSPPPPARMGEKGGYTGKGGGEARVGWGRGRAQRREMLNRRAVRATRDGSSAGLRTVHRTAARAKPVSPRPRGKAAAQ